MTDRLIAFVVRGPNRPDVHVPYISADAPLEEIRDYAGIAALFATTESRQPIRVADDRVDEAHALYRLAENYMKTYHPNG